MVEAYLEYTKDAPSPPMFRKWAMIHAIGAAAERRVWTTIGINRLHPNLFIFLVGPPGTGKSQAINPAAEVLRKSQACFLAPTDMTKQGLLDALATATKGVIIDGVPMDYHFMAISISELSNFMSQYDHALAGLLTDLFDCPPINEEKKRSGAGKTIPFPGISFIMGTATQNLGNTIADDMWGSGFMARVILVFSADEIVPDDMFALVEKNEELYESLATALRRIGDLKGPMEWEPDAAALFNTFRKRNKEGAPLHNRLEYYVIRRWLHLGKLCMIAALSDERMTVRTEDFQLALGWLQEAEAVMPEVFKDMQSHSDGQIYEELRGFLYAVWIKFKRPLKAELAIQWLSKRTGVHAVQRILEIAEAGGYIERVAGTFGPDALFIPTAPGSKH